MKILFLVQGEGRGHMTQAIGLSQALESRGHVVTEVYLGISPQRVPPLFFKEHFHKRLRYFNSPNFKSTSDRKGINLIYSFLYNSFRIPLYVFEIFRIARVIRKSEAERVINFYDIIGALAWFISFSGKKYYVISHHYFFNHPDFIWPRKFNIQKWLLCLYNFICALGAEKKIALSFSESTGLPGRRIVVVPPLLRKEVYELKSSDQNYILVYLLNPGFIGEIILWCENNRNRKVVVFADKIEEDGLLPPNLIFEAIQGKKFLNILAGCECLFCTSGFETVAEAAYLGKKIFVIPSKNHYEQKCNASDAERSGIALEVQKFDPLQKSINSDELNSYKHHRAWFLKNPEMIIRIIT